MFVQPIALIGTGSYAMEIVDAIEKKKDSGFKIVALVGKKHPSLCQTDFLLLKILQDLPELCVQRCHRKNRRGFG